MTAAHATTARAAAAFHELTVRSIEELTADAVALGFAVPAELAPAYAWAPGQHLAVRVPGDQVRRSYSLCPAADGRLRIGVRRLPGGLFSERTLAGLRIGDAVEVMTPAGRFGAALPGLRRPVFVAAGSGITPVLAMAAAALADPDVAEVGLVVGNRTQASVMFLDELADLKDTHPTRLNLVHVLSRETQESPLLSGRLDAERFRAIRDRLLVADGVDGWFLCGPQALIAEVRAALLADGVPAASVHTELFHAETGAPRVPVPAPAAGTTASVRLGGRSTEVVIAPGAAVLDELLRVRPDAPYACKGGVCGTCRARVLEGEVVMDAAWALEPDEIAAGYVLTCQAHPITARLVLDYDA